MLLAGLGLMGFVARRGNRQPLDPSQQHSHRPPAWRGFDLHVGNDRYRLV
jgi:hypothetical protein